MPSSGGSPLRGSSPARRAMGAGPRVVLSRSSATPSTRATPITIAPRRGRHTTRMAGAAAQTGSRGIPRAGPNGRRASGLLSRYHPSLIRKRGSGRKSNSGRTRSAPSGIRRRIGICCAVSWSAGRCSRRMVGSWSASGGRYICALRYPRHVPGACAGRSLSAPTIE